ncbi:hypothetical protein [Prescottella equi]|uniref:hypothetical protein n=1 Tax=Rhodococcus hoagii TaxID=43767 RepID=UPI001EEB1CAF|nr:hypothetical protein [Prescottella equi]
MRIAEGGHLSGSTVRTGPEDERDLHVLTLQAVKAGVEALRAQPIHEHFPAYLHIRECSIIAGSLNDLKPQWSKVGGLLRVPGGPPKKPHYRPFSTHDKDPGDYWFNPNLAGSYAISSLRKRSRFMVNATDDGFALPADHAQQARDLLLSGKQVPAWALAAYYLRDYGFSFGGDGGYRELIDAFRGEFLFNGDDDFDVLFEDIDPMLSIAWFEPYVPMASGLDAHGKKEDETDD